MPNASLGTRHTNKQKKYMKISIITITYNSAKTLQRALDSIQSQTYKDIEHIIVDGASTDGTKEIIETYAAKHPNVQWISEPDEGIYNAINKGIRLATGDVIGFLHSDDVLKSADSIDIYKIMHLFVDLACLYA